MKALTYLVPVDFSECSFNALQYATMLARASQGNVKLFHVIDLEEVPESDNPVVVSFALDRLSKKAHEKMKSLQEIISLDGVTVDENIVMGNVRLELLKQIDKEKPHVIVMGRNTDRQPRPNSLVTYITRNTKVPVLVVPKSHNPKIPNRAVLATDLKTNKVGEFAPFFEIIKKISQEISILNIKGRAIANGKDENEWIQKLNSTYGINAKFLNHENNGTRVEDFIRSNEVDLLCTMKRNHSFFDKLFSRNNSNPLTEQAEVPVLVFNSGSGMDAAPL